MGPISNAMGQKHPKDRKKRERSKKHSKASARRQQAGPKTRAKEQQRTRVTIHNGAVVANGTGAINQHWARQSTHWSNCCRWHWGRISATHWGSCNRWHRGHSRWHWGHKINNALGQLQQMALGPGSNALGLLQQMALGPVSNALGQLLSCRGGTGASQQRTGAMVPPPEFELLNTALPS